MAGRPFALCLYPGVSSGLCTSSPRQWQIQAKTKGSLGLAPTTDVRWLVLCCVTLGESLPLSEPLFLSCQPPGVGRLPAFVLLGPKRLVKGPVIPQISADSSQPPSCWHPVGCDDWQEPLPGLLTPGRVAGPAAPAQLPLGFMARG